MALITMHMNAFAGDVSAGLYSSPKGFGFSLDHAATDDIINSYTIYADVYGLYNGRYNGAGVKIQYLHYNRLASYDIPHAKIDILLGPGGSTGYVRDLDSDRFGMLLTADIALALRIRFQRNFDMEAGTAASLGFISDNSSGKLQIGIYNNGLLQALYPSIKLMIRF